MKNERYDNEPELIHAYTRAQAIADGILVDVSSTAREAGFTIPVAITAAVHAAYVLVPYGVTGQDEAGRLWDILWMLHHAIYTSSGSTSRLTYVCYVRNSDEAAARLVALVANCGPGDDGEPVLTIMLPNED